MLVFLLIYGLGSFLVCLFIAYCVLVSWWRKTFAARPARPVKPLQPDSYIWPTIEEFYPAK